MDKSKQKFEISWPLLLKKHLNSDRHYHARTICKEGIYFIGNEAESDISALRNILLDNTKAMLGLLRERRILAKRIGENKNASDVPFRDRQRELDVISAIGKMTLEDRRFLSLLFELTIQEEALINGKGKSKNDEDSHTTILGGFDGLSFLAGYLSTTPGAELLSEIDNKQLFQGVLARGGHVIEKGPISGLNSFQVSAGRKPLVEVRIEGKMTIFWHALDQLPHRIEVKAVKA